METDGGGWIVIQRRNASMGWVNFTRNIADYENGFGDVDGEFWIGLRIIHELTNQQNMAMKMRVWNESGNSMNWNYQQFSIYNKNNRYAIYRLSGSSGDGSYDPFGQTINTNTHFHTPDYHYPGWNNCGTQDRVDGGTIMVTVAVIQTQMAVTNQVVSVEQI